MTDLPVPDDDGGLDPVLEIHDLVLCRQVYRLQELVGVEDVVGYDLVYRVSENGPSILQIFNDEETSSLSFFF